MKRMLVATAALAVALSSGAASAQPYRDRDHDGVPNRYDRHDGRVYRDRDHDGVPNRYDRHDNRRHWNRGDRLDSRFHRRDYMVSDYRRYGWRPPPRGYAYYRTDTGDVVMAAVATGIISGVLANALTR